MLAEDRLHVIILAAGAGRRLGRDKATLPWGPTTLLRHIVDQFPAERVARCIVVVNVQNRDRVSRDLSEAVEIVVNPDPNAEMIASVRVAIDALGPIDGPLCIHPVDVFAISPELIALLHEAWRAAPHRIHLPEVNGKGGHPLVVPPNLVEAVRTLPAGRGLNWLLREHAADVNRHAWHDRRLIEDIDTPEDYIRHRPPVA